MNLIISGKYSSKDDRERSRDRRERGDVPRQREHGAGSGAGQRQRDHSSGATRDKSHEERRRMKSLKERYYLGNVSNVNHLKKQTNELDIE